MKRRIKQCLLLLWQLLYPLLIYQFITETVYFFCLHLLDGVRPDQILAITGAAAAIASIPLGIFYWKMIAYREMTDDYPADIIRGTSLHRFPAILWTCPAGIGACMMMNGIMIFLNVTTDTFEEVSGMLYSPPFLTQLLCTALLAPFAEELIFRGLVYFRLRRVMAFLPAAFISSVYFAIFHGNLPQGIYALVLGFMLAACAECFDSLTAACLFHMTANLVSVLLANLPVDRHPYLALLLFVSMVPLGACLLALALFRIFTFYKIREDGKQRETVIDSDTML